MQRLETLLLKNEEMALKDEKLNMLSDLRNAQSIDMSDEKHARILSRPLSPHFSSLSSFLLTLFLPFSFFPVPAHCGSEFVCVCACPWENTFAYALDYSGCICSVSVCVLRNVHHPEPLCGG